MNTTQAVAARVQALRRAFDQSFALPPAAPAAEYENLLAIRVHRDRYALRLRELSGLQLKKKIVPLPGGPAEFAEFLGIAGVRGKVVPVFSLARLLGYAEEDAEGRWLALCGTDEPLALAFAQFDGHHPVACADIRLAGDGSGRTHVRELVHIAGAACPLISVASIHQAIEQGAGSAGPPRKE